MNYQEAIQCLQVMKGAECINMLGSEFPEHYGDENIKAIELAIYALKSCGQEKVSFCPECGQRVIFKEDALGGETE